MGEIQGNISEVKANVAANSTELENLKADVQGSIDEVKANLADNTSELQKLKVREQQGRVQQRSVSPADRSVVSLPSFAGSGGSRERRKQEDEQARGGDSVKKVTESKAETLSPDVAAQAPSYKWTVLAQILPEDWKEELDYPVAGQVLQSSDMEKISGVCDIQVLLEAAYIVEAVRELTLTRMATDLDRIEAKMDDIQGSMLLLTTTVGVNASSLETLKTDVKSSIGEVKADIAANTSELQRLKAVENEREMNRARATSPLSLTYSGEDDAESSPRNMATQAYIEGPLTDAVWTGQPIPTEAQAQEQCSADTKYLGYIEHRNGKFFLAVSGDKSYRAGSPDFMKSTKVKAQQVKKEKTKGDVHIKEVVKEEMQVHFYTWSPLAKFLPEDWQEELDYPAAGKELKPIDVDKITEVCDMKMLLDAGYLVEKIVDVPHQLESLESWSKEHDGRVTGIVEKKMELVSDNIMKRMDERMQEIDEKFSDVCKKVEALG
jgi:hypothetical protein